mgnify:CR=1 FL=1
MTKREMYVAIMNVDAVAENAEMVEFLQHQIDLLDNRKGSNKPTKTQTENEGIKNDIYDILAENGNRMRVSEIAQDARMEGYHPNKISALLRQMLPEVGDGRVVKEIEKKVSYFRIAD